MSISYEQLNLLRSCNAGTISGKKYSLEIDIEIEIVVFRRRGDNKRLKDSMIQNAMQLSYLMI